MNIFLLLATWLSLVLNKGETQYQILQIWFMSVVVTSDCSRISIPITNSLAHTATSTCCWWLINIPWFVEHLSQSMNDTNGSDFVMLGHIYNLWLYFDIIQLAGSGLFWIHAFAKKLRLSEQPRLYQHIINISKKHASAQFVLWKGPIGANLDCSGWLLSAKAEAQQCKGCTLPASNILLHSWQQFVMNCILKQSYS